ncbi:MAG: Ig-like domain-containing protein [Alphaproteobacteria bacterium]|nr:Ig-like domain-containing protein [Alphaproteobacteria bacterium]
MRTSLLLPALLLACTAKDDAPVTPEDSEPSVIRESSLLDDSGDTSADDSGDDTGDTAIEMVSLSLTPGTLLVDIGASYSLRATLTGSDNKPYPSSPSFSSSDEAVATVSAEGVVTAIGPGEATLLAEDLGLSASATVTVQEVPDLYVRVVDANTGEPLEGARVIWGNRQANTDADGRTSLGVTAASAATITAFLPDSDYIPVSVVGVVARDVVVPLRPGAEEEGAPAQLSGDVDYSEVVEAEWDEQVIGLVGPSLQRSPLLFDPGQLLAPDRDVTLYGVPASLPGNLYVQGALDDWQALSWEGDLALWTLAGPVPVEELTSGFTSTGEALGLVLSHLEAFRYDALTELSVGAEGLSGLSVAPSASLDGTLYVEVPAPPEGAQSGQDALLVVLEDQGEAGWLLVGLDLASEGYARVSVLPGEGERAVLAYYEQGGVGSGDGHAVSVAPVNRGRAELDAWMSPPVYQGLDAVNRELSLTSDTRASAVRVYIRAPGGGGHRDLWLPAGEQVARIPDSGPEVGLGRPNLEILAVETGAQTWESLLCTGGLAESALVADGRSSAGWAGRVQQ